MAKFCQNCGKSLADHAQFCDGCGAAQPTAQQAGSAPSPAPAPAPAAAGYSPEDIEKNKTMAALAYILFFLPLVVCPDSPYGRYHANQGLLVLILGVGGSIALAILGVLLALVRLWFLSSLLSIVFSLAVLALVVIGIINAVNGQAKPLPVIGNIKLIK